MLSLTFHQVPLQSDSQVQELAQAPCGYTLAIWKLRPSVIACSGLQGLTASWPVPITSSMNQTVPLVTNWPLYWSSSKGISAMAGRLLFLQCCSRAMNSKPESWGRGLCWQTDTFLFICVNGLFHQGFHVSTLSSGNEKFFLIGYYCSMCSGCEITSFLH